MEKLRISKSTKRCIGLLILFLISTINLFAISYNQLRIEPEKEYCFTGETCDFILKIPGVLPVNVDNLVQSTPANVTIENSSKSEYIENGTRGTIIKLTFRFAKAGTYQIPPLATRIYWTSYAIRFLPIIVYDNPILLTPELSSDLPSTLEVGKPTTFTLYGKFFNELTDVNFQLDTKVLLKKTQDLQPLPFHIGTFSTDVFPLAEFTIIPLEEGTYTLPPIFGLFRTYAGNSVTIKLENKKIKVIQSTPNSNESILEQDNSFLNTFPEALVDETILNSLESQKTEISISNILNEELKTKKIISILLIFSLIFTLLTLLLTVISFILKRKSSSITFLSLFIIFLSCSIIFFVINNNKKAISLGGRVRTVPEENSNSVMQLTKGDIVILKDEVTDWYSIELKDNRKGWILKSECLLIEKESKQGNKL